MLVFTSPTPSIKDWNLPRKAIHSWTTEINDDGVTILFRPPWMQPRLKY